MVCRSGRASSGVQDVMFCNLRCLDYFLIDFTNHNEWQYIRMDTAKPSVTTPCHSSSSKLYIFLPNFFIKRIYLNLPHVRYHKTAALHRNNLYIFITQSCVQLADFHISIQRWTYSMQQSPSWEAKWFSFSQEIPCTVWNLKVLYRIHTCPPPVHTQPVDPVHAPTPTPPTVPVLQWSATDRQFLFMWFRILWWGWVDCRTCDLFLEWLVKYSCAGVDHLC